MSKTSASRPPEEPVMAALRHLKQATQLLLATSPSTSAYLGSQSLRLASDLHVIPKDQQKDRTCHGCGSTLIPGWSCKRYRKHVQKPQKNTKVRTAAGISKTTSKAKANPPKLDHVAYECDGCHSITRFILPEKKPLPEKTKVLETVRAIKDSTIAPLAHAAAAATLPSQPQSVKVATEVSGRKRAKKNKSGGLAALLARSKSESASPAAFDLMDFMKTA